ncbi:hypothetical protein ACOSQ2_017664 [Xanthoceras sorbifolium]
MAVGRAVVTLSEGRLALDRLGALCEQLKELNSQGYEIIFVTLGAVGLGCQRIRYRKLVNSRSPLDLELMKGSSSMSILRCEEMPMAEGGSLNQVEDEGRKLNRGRPKRVNDHQPTFEIVLALLAVGVSAYIPMSICVQIYVYFSSHGFIISNEKPDHPGRRKPKTKEEGGQ